MNQRQWDNKCGKILQDAYNKIAILDNDYINSNNLGGDVVRIFDGITGMLISKPDFTGKPCIKFYPYNKNNILSQDGERFRGPMEEAFIPIESQEEV